MTTKKQQESERQRESTSSEEGDLKSREYRDEKGEVHHHTKKYMEQHEGEKEEEK